MGELVHTAKRSCWLAQIRETRGLGQRWACLATIGEIGAPQQSTLRRSPSSLNWRLHGEELLLLLRARTSVGLLWIDTYRILHHYF